MNAGVVMSAAGAAMVIGYIAYAIGYRHGYNRALDWAEELLRDYRKWAENNEAR